MKTIKNIVFLALAGVLAASCTGGNKTSEMQNADTETKKLRIVSLNSSVAETIAAIGQQDLIEGLDALLKMPGVSQTNAGKNRKIITMDEGLIFSFGPRVGQAVKELNETLATEK